MIQAPPETQLNADKQQFFKPDIKAYFDRMAPEIDRWSQRNAYYYEDLAQLHQFLIPSGSRVLEVGCGTGDLLQTVAPSLGVGIDFAPAVVAIARDKHPHLNFYCLEAETLTPEALDPAHRCFDYVVLSGVLGYLEDIQTTLEQLQLFCHARTRLILTFHNYMWEPILRFAEALGQRRPQPIQSWLSMRDVVNLLSVTGYLPVKTGRRFLCPKRLPGVSFLANRYVGPLPLFKHLCLTNFVVARPAPNQGGQIASSPDAAASALVPSPLKAPLALPSCSVVIPARNEAGNIRSAIARLPELGCHTEVIFVEGHSQDETWAEIQALMADYDGPFTLKALQQTGRGKADAVRLGFAEATGDILLILDADLTVTPEDLPHFVKVIASGRGEFVNGSRLVYPRSRTAMPWLNTMANKIFALLFSFLLEQPLKDTLCGTKVLSRQDYQRIAAGRDYFGEFDPFGDFDLLFGAAKLNLHIVEVPIRYQPRTYGESNIAHVKEGLILLKMCLYASRKLKFI